MRALDVESESEVYAEATETLFAQYSYAYSAGLPLASALRGCTGRTP
jgi:hypothetical protein